MNCKFISNRKTNRCVQKNKLPWKPMRISGFQERMMPRLHGAFLELPVIEPEVAFGIRQLETVFLLSSFLTINEIFPNVVISLKPIAKN
jgi:hypothetical protein